MKYVQLCLSYFKQPPHVSQLHEGLKSQFLDTGILWFLFLFSNGIFEGHALKYSHHSRGKEETPHIFFFCRGKRDSQLTSKEAVNYLCVLLSKFSPCAHNSHMNIKELPLQISFRTVPRSFNTLVKCVN